MKLFTKADNAKLFANYSKGSDMATQNVVIKIFNPYGNGRWYIMNSDPNDPDYLWGIVDLGYGAEVGSISRSDLENYTNRIGFGFERDMSFSPKNAKMVLEGLRNGEFFAGGGNLSRDRKYVNYREDYEVRYSKGKGRHGYGNLKFDGGGEVEFIDYGDSEIMFEPNSKKYYANDMEFDTLQEAKKFIDSGEIPYFIKDAYSKGLFADGGAIKNQYEGRTAKNVWENLSKTQKGHFLYDHIDEIEVYKKIDMLPTSEIRVAYNSDWMSLDKDIKNRFSNHIREGQYKRGGKLLSTKQRYIAEFVGLSGLSKNAIETYVEENNLTDNEVLHIVIGLGRKQINASDVNTAIVGKKDNSYSKKLLAFAMSDEALKAEYGAFMDGVYAGGGEVYSHKHSKGWGEDITIELLEPTDRGWKVKQTTKKGRKTSTKTAFFSKQQISELFEKQYAKGGIVVTSIQDIPNFKKNLDDGKITYRGLGMGKVFNDFYEKAGESGTRIKVDGKEYFITDTEFDSFSRGADGKMRIRFDAPQRKGYEVGGKTTFDDKSSAIAKNFVGKEVEPKHQKEYGKRYDEEEAKEVGNKIAGKQKASYKKKSMKGGGVVHSQRLKKVNQIAREIRKDGEDWRVALKRAYTMIK